MFGNGYFGASYYAPSYFGPNSSVTVTGGGKVKKRKWTEEELKGLEDYGKARLGITDEIEVAPDTIEAIIAPDEIVTPETYETETGFADEINLSPTLPEISILDNEIDEDILLIIAMLEAHNL